MIDDFVVGKVYRSSHFKNKYIRVLGIGNDYIHVAEYEIEYPWYVFNKIMNFFNSRWDIPSIVNYTECRYSRHHHGWDEVPSVDPKTKMVQIHKNYNFNDLVLNVDILPSSHWVVGEKYIFMDAEYTLLSVGNDTVFVRGGPGNREIVRLKSTNWIRK